ncbi:MAG: protein meaA [Candidatus Dadabacteria bacterium RBG_19FT_COMBO_40_33]|jgi:(2R)-ethylmalonyl-CoA mutase|nr:MAG: protein meaA [Candidatus Dadabacteria bacterium RBG_19FT_COMBO_40_33]
MSSKPEEKPKKQSFDKAAQGVKDNPWIMRTYAGHTTAKASNELFRKNLAKGQTGLSVAFDLPTQTGYDSVHPLAEGEVGKVGVPIGHIEDMDALFDKIPIEKMNTSMTINATAAWLLSLYIALAERRGVDISQLEGTTQNDILKEYLSRGTYIFPPKPSMRLISDTITFTFSKVPKWNPINICSYHLQEAGATPVQEIAFTLANAIAVLDTVRESGQIPKDRFPQVVGRISFFVNAGIRFIEEMCKMRAFTEMWDELTLKRYGVGDEKYRRFRYGVQVNSLGLTAQQPENNIARILLEMLAVTLSKNARARAIQLPAWNEALGLPRPWDQQWSLRFQQILAYETDLLEYPDIFDGSPVIERKGRDLKKEAWKEIERIEEIGGALSAIEKGYMKMALVASHAERVRAIEKGEIQIVGVNCFTETEQSPLVQSVEESIQKVDPKVVRQQLERLKAFKIKRNEKAVKEALRELSEAAKSDINIMPASIHCAHAGVTTGEWADTFRRVFGEYRAPTGTSITLREDTNEIRSVRNEVKSLREKLGRPPKVLIGKPGLDGHSNGAEQIAVRARDVGMEVLYQGIRLTPEEIVSTAEQENVDIIGLSILSGSHDTIIPKIMNLLNEKGLGDIPVIAGGIIPDDDAKLLIATGIKRVYTPKDYSLNRIMHDIVEIIKESKDNV